MIKVNHTDLENELRGSLLAFQTLIERYEQARYVVDQVLPAYGGNFSQMALDHRLATGNVCSELIKLGKLAEKVQAEIAQEGDDWNK